jgi:hypothetical protein
VAITLAMNRLRYAYLVMVVWGALFSLQRLNLRVLRHPGTRFPTPPDEP